MTTTEPLLLGEYALGLVAAWYLAPPLLKLAAGAVRGYAGEVTPAAALTAVESDVRRAGAAALRTGAADLLELLWRPVAAGAGPCFLPAMRPRLFLGRPMSMPLMIISTQPARCSR